MFFDDHDLTLKKHSRLRLAPPIPETGWRPPAYFPNLSAATVIAFDVETKERDFAHGPGWARGKSHVCGFSVAARAKGGETGKWYFPIRHEVGSDWNLDPKNSLGWLDSQLNTKTPKVGANLLYDIGSLGEEGVRVDGKLHDVQFAEALLDEEGEVNLDFLARKYLRRNKTSDALYEWLAQAYGGNPTPKQRENIYRAPPALVGPYGEDDADLPLQILEKQWPELQREGLRPLFELENRLIPLLIKMRRQGVRIDVNYAEQLYGHLGSEIERLTNEFSYSVGMHVNVNSGKDLAALFDKVGLKYPKTAEGAPSFQKEFLKELEHPVANSINSIREYIKIRSTFVKSYMLESHINGLIYCQFHPLKGDENGTKTGRLASSTPNLQNIPVRTALGKKVRKAFIPHVGHWRWRKFDYSQIEYRILAHFAVDGASHRYEFGRVLDFWQNAAGVWGMDGVADALRQSYNDDPTIDYHKQVMTAFALEKGIDLSKMSKDEIDTFRKPIKNVNFGLLYGQTEKALAYKAGLNKEQAKSFFATYHSTASYVKPTMAAISQEVQHFGYVRTITGRRTRFNLWQPAGYGEKGYPLPYRAALAEYGGNIKRAYAYRGTNYKFQGSAADVIKIAMDAAHTSGVFDYIGYPLLQVHDELDFSERDDTPAMREAYAHLQHLLETSVKLKIPVKVDSSHGIDWSEAK